MRKKRSDKRRTMADPRFNDVMIAKFVNNIMIQGKKNTARKIVYEALDIVGKKTETDPIEVFRKAIQNVSPAIEIRPRRVGGATFQIPTPVREDRKASLAMKWLIGYSRKRNEKTMAGKLASEIIAASKEEGAAYKKKEDTLRMAEANKAFSHFRF